VIVIYSISRKKKKDAAVEGRRQGLLSMSEKGGEPTIFRNHG